MIVRALAIAAPVLDRLAGTARLRVGGSAAYLEFADGFVAVLCGPRVPWLPNAIVLDGPLPARDGLATARAGELSLPGWSARWPPERPPRFSPFLAPLRPGAPLAARGEAIVTEVGAPPPEVGPALVGRGPGLTPEGDDVLAGACAVLAAAGRPDRAAALLPAALRGQTTALSATLLELAARGAAAAPLHAVVDPRRDDWRAALADLRGLGHTSGAAMALGAGVAAAGLAGARHCTA